MSVGHGLRRRLERLARTTPVHHFVAPERLARFVMWAAVGVSGVVVDLAVTFSLLGRTHYLLANLAGFLLAVSWNFGWNWHLTYSRPDGTLWKQYASYVLLHGVTFGARAVVIAAGVEILGTPEGVATVVGVVVAALLNFAGTESIMQAEGELWFDAVAALNATAHYCYAGWMRTWLQRLRLYDPAYTAFTVVIGLLYRGQDYTVHAAGASASIAMPSRSVVASVMHTMNKEQTPLSRFVSELESDDVVWDVGANLGVYTVLAGQVAAEVVAIEPFEPNVAVLRENIERNDGRYTVVPAALGHTADTVELAVHRDEPGAQRPAVGGDGDRTTAVDMVTGRRLVAQGVSAPDVLKIDVEGAEASVIEGCQPVLKDVRVVFCETHDTGATVEYLLADAGFDVQHTTLAGQEYVFGRR